MLRPAGWGGVGAGKLEEHWVWVGKGASGRSCYERTYKWLRAGGGGGAVGVITWKQVSEYFRHFATVLELCDNFRLTATILD